MRIAIFSDTYVPEINGVALTLQRYTDYLEESGIEYQLFVPSSSEPVPSVPQVQRLMSIPFILYRNCRFTIPNPAHINQVLDKFQPTLIHIATPFNIGLYGLHYGKKNHIPMVASYHTHFDDYLAYYHLSFFKNAIWKYMEWFHRSFEKVYAPSLSTKEKLLSRKIHTDIDIWGRGVDHRFYSPIKKSPYFFKEYYQIKNKKILLYVGRIAPEKDIQMVLDTFYHLPEHLKKDAQLVIVGDGPLYETLSKQHQESITWTGFLEGEPLSAAYASSDLFLFPSSTETFGNVVLEALSSGLPVIGANAGGVQNLIEDGVNGFLCEPKNLEAFTRKTAKLLEDKSTRDVFAAEARKFAKTQSWDEIFHRLIESLDDVGKRKQRISA